MLKIREEKDLKIAIDLWKYVIGRAYYEDDKKSMIEGFFYIFITKFFIFFNYS
jgi:hypothetical protein